MSSRADRAKGGPRRWARRLGAFVFWLLLSLGALLASAFAHLDQPVGREATCAELEAQVSALLRGSLEVERCAALRPGRLRLEGIALRSADGAPLARIDALEVRPALGRLLRGELALEGGDLEAPRLDLADMDAFLDAVSLAEPSEEEDDEESGPLPDVALGRWRLDRGAVTLADGLVVQGLELDARGSLGPAVAVEVAQLAAEVELDGEPLARLERTAGALDLGPSAESRLELAIRSGPEAAPDRVDVEARATWGEALADGPARVGAVVDLDVSRQLARRAGAPEVAELLATERVRGHVEAGGALDDLSAEGRLETDAGVVSLEASMEGARYAAAVETAGLALHQLIGTAPEASARGRVEATMAPLEAGPDGEAAAQRVTVRGEGLAYDVYGLEAFELVADLHEEHVELQSLDVPHLERGGHLDLEGRVGFDGDVDVRLDARLPQLARDPNLRRLVPGLRAGVELDLRARLDGEEIDARGHVGVTALELDGTEVERLRVTGRVHGAPGLPRANVSVQGAGLAAAGLRVRELDLSVAGGPVGEGADRGVYRLEGGVDEAGGRRLDLALRAEVEGERVRLDGTTRLAGLYPTPLTVALTAVRLDADAVAFERVELRDRGGAVAFDASGRYGFGGALDVRARLTRLELAALDRALGLEAELVGAVEADLRAAGRQTAPVVDADVRLEGVGAASVPPVGGTVHLALAQVDRAAEARLELDLEGALGRVDAGGHARFPTRDPARRPEEAEGEVRLSVAGVDLAAVGALAELEELEGRLDAELRATGSALQPRGHLELEGRAIRWAGGDPITVDADADVGAEARARVAVADGAGTIAELRAGLPLPVAGLARLDALGALDAPWTLELDVARRRLDGYPAPLRVDLPLEVGLALRGAGGEAGPTLHAEADARWSEGEGAGSGEGEDPDATPPEPACGGAPLVTARVVLDVEDGHAAARVAARERGEARLTAETGLEVPLRRWLQTGFPTTPPQVAVVFGGEGVELGRVPIACEHATGRLRLAGSARSVPGPRPVVDLRGQVEQLAVAGAPPVDVAFTAGANERVGEIDLGVREGGREALRLVGAAPLSWDEAGVPTLRDEPWSARLTLDRAPFAPLVAAVPRIAEPSGALDGRFDVRGVGAEIEAEGALELLSVSATVTDPFIRVEELQGRIALQDERVRIEGLRYRDRDGTFRADGTVALEEWMPRRAEIELATHELPVRVDGVIFAYLDAEARVRAQLEDERTEADVVFEQLSVRLPEESGRTVQSLDAHPDVEYVDATGFHEVRFDDEEAASGEGADGDDAPEAPATLAIRVRTRPFWVRRSDFGIQLRAELAIRDHGDGVRLEGPIEVRRGFLELLGKRFEMERGVIRFTGGRSVDPRVQLEAVHELAGGDTVSVIIAGFLSQPTLTFQSEAADSEQEAIDLLLRGRSTSGSERSAQEQAASVLTGLMAGMLSSLTRREVGAFVPVFAIESTGSQSGQIRAGFQIDQLIPPFLEDIVQGIYLEGQLGVDGQSETPSATGGVLLELLFPRDLVGTGRWQGGSNAWSIDLTWEPL